MEKPTLTSKPQDWIPGLTRASATAPSSSVVSGREGSPGVRWAVFPGGHTAPGTALEQAEIPQGHPATGAGWGVLQQHPSVKGPHPTGGFQPLPEGQRSQLSSLALQSSQPRRQDLKGCSPAPSKPQGVASQSISTVTGNHIPVAASFCCHGAGTPAWHLAPFFPVSKTGRCWAALPT